MATILGTSNCLVMGMSDFGDVGAMCDYEPELVVDECADAHASDVNLAWWTSVPEALKVRCPALEPAA